MDLTLITDIGDSFVLSAIVISGAAYLYGCGCRKGAVALLLSLLGAAVLIGLAKLFVGGCNDGLRHYDIHSPSGHAALTVSVLGTCAVLIASQLRGFWRWVPVILLMPLMGAIAASRVILGFHSAPEVTIGLIIGGITLLLVWLFLRYGSTLPKFNIYWLIFSALAIAVLLNGCHLPAEAFIQFFAAYIKIHVPFCAK